MTENVCVNWLVLAV